jgi:hypothetical protein
MDIIRLCRPVMCMVGSVIVYIVHGRLWREESTASPMPVLSAARGKSGDRCASGGTNEAVMNKKRVWMILPALGAAAVAAGLWAAAMALRCPDSCPKVQLGPLLFSLSY